MLLGRWGSAKRLSFVLLEILLLASHFLHHVLWITAVVFAVGVGVVTWRSKLDAEEERWGEHGGYEIRLSRTIVDFRDPTGHEVVVRKEQTLYAYGKNIHEIEDGNISGTGSIGNIAVSPPGELKHYELEGAQRRYKTVLNESMPFRRPYERWIEITYIDAYLEEIETHTNNVVYGTRETAIRFRFNTKRIPIKVEVWERGLRSNKNLSTYLKAIASDGSECEFVYKRPETGMRFVFRITFPSSEAMRLSDEHADSSLTVGNIQRVLTRAGLKCEEPERLAILQLAHTHAIASIGKLRQLISKGRIGRAKSIWKAAHGGKSGTDIEIICLLFWSLDAGDVPHEKVYMRRSAELLRQLRALEPVRTAASSSESARAG